MSLDLVDLKGIQDYPDCLVKAGHLDCQESPAAPVQPEHPVPEGGLAASVRQVPKETPGPPDSPDPPVPPEAPERLDSLAHRGRWG